MWDEHRNTVSYATGIHTESKTRFRENIIGTVINAYCLNLIQTKHAINRSTLNTHITIRLLLNVLEYLLKQNATMSIWVATVAHEYNVSLYTDSIHGGKIDLNRKHHINGVTAKSPQAKEDSIKMASSIMDFLD